MLYTLLPCLHLMQLRRWRGFQLEVVRLCYKGKWLEEKTDFRGGFSRVLMEASKKALSGDIIVRDDVSGFYDLGRGVGEIIKLPNWILRTEIQARTKLVDRLIEKWGYSIANGSSLAMNKLRIWPLLYSKNTPSSSSIMMLSRAGLKPIRGVFEGSLILMSILCQ